MKKVYTHHDRWMVFQIKQLLDSKHIPCFIKNEFAIGAMGDLAPMDVLPEVWVNDAEWSNKASEIIQEFSLQAKSDDNWVCNDCQEHNASNFEICWQCGADSAP